MSLRWMTIGLCILLASFMAAATEEVHEAARTGNLEQLKRLLDENQALVNSRDTDKNTPLHLAIDSGHLKAASLLIERGAEIDAVNYKTETPLHIAANKGNTDATRLLLQYGADPNLREMRDRIPLFLACNWENDLWIEPKEMSPRLDGYLSSFSADGKKLLFNSRRTDPPDLSFTRILYIEREINGWSEPKYIDFGEDYQGGSCMSPSMAANGNLYFAKWPTREKGIIYISRYEDGKYTLPERLSDTINDIGGNHPHIAPDESYIVYDWEYPEDNYGQNDIMISFRDKNGKWMKPQNLGERVNTRYDERRPFVSFDGKYLFFVSARINPKLPDKPMTLTELKKRTNVYANGFHHVYWVDAKIIARRAPTEKN